MSRYQVVNTGPAYEYLPETSNHLKITRSEPLAFQLQDMSNRLPLSVYNPRSDSSPSLLSVLDLKSSSKMALPAALVDHTRDVKTLSGWADPQGRRRSYLSVG